MKVRLSTLIAQLQDLADDLGDHDPEVVGIVQPSYPMIVPLLGLAWNQEGPIVGHVFLQMGGNSEYAPREFTETVGFDCDMDDE